ncbi:MAG: adenosine kinase, partial [Glaciecola sp.]
MRIAVTGSIATDHLMTFPGKFVDNLMPDNLANLSISFLVDALEVRRGGVAPNISFGLAQLGHEPVLIGAVGRDFDTDYRSWLDRHGVETSAVLVSDLKHTARFLCTTDADQNQIASFYTGAMAEARDIELAPILRRFPDVELVVISPNDPEAMLRHTEEARRLNLPFMADPSQQLTYMDGPEIRGLIEGATYLVTNHYEKGLLEQKTGWSDAEVLDRVGLRITTKGAEGCIIESRGEEPIIVH